MRRFFLTFGSTAIVLGSSLIAAGQDKGPQAPLQAPDKQAPLQAPMQAPMKQAPMQAPAAPVKQAPMQAPMQAPSKQAPLQAPMQAPSKQAPLQAPQKMAPLQAPMQAPMKHVQGPQQSPVQKGGYGGPPMAMTETYEAAPMVAMSRPGVFRRR
jgi:hypothetical protein